MNDLFDDVFLTFPIILFNWIDFQLILHTIEICLKCTNYELASVILIDEVHKFAKPQKLHNYNNNHLLSE